MKQEMGETRDAIGYGLMDLINTWVNNLKHETEPYYLVFHAKPDVAKQAILQGIQAYRQRPPKLLGILVWYVDNKSGKVELVPELSSPPDMPTDQRILSEKAEDALPDIMERGEKFNVLTA